MLRRLAGLIGVVAGAIMFVTLIPVMVDGFDAAWSSSTQVWEQIKAVVNTLWSSLFQPLVLVLLGLIALTSK